MAQANAPAQGGAAPSGTGRRFDDIDVLRGLAALTVTLGHYVPYWDRYVGDIPVLVPSAAGNYAVRLFFAISGLVILLTLERCRSVVDFAVLRFSRLYPTYWTTLVLATAGSVLVFGTPFWTNGFIVNLTMLQEFAGVSNFDNVYWSLTVELAFYLNVGWLFVLGLHRQPLRCATVWLCAALAWAMLADSPRDSARDWAALLLALDYAPYFAIGIAAFVGRDRAWNRWEWGLVALALLVEVRIAGVEGLAVASGVLVLVYLSTRGLLAFAVNRVTLWLGSISYALYLVHRNLGYQVLDWLGEQGLGPVAAIVLTTAGALGIAALVTMLVERPASAGLRRRYRALTGAPGAVSAST